jgi:hypothetical protein
MKSNKNYITQNIRIVNNNNNFSSTKQNIKTTTQHDIHTEYAQRVHLYTV